MSTEASRLAEVRLWQLLSPSLPVGAFAYSDGLESAIANHHVCDPATARNWLSGVGDESIANVDLPYLAALYRSLDDNNYSHAAELNTQLIARRETSELRASDCHQGSALVRLLNAIGVASPENSPDKRATTFAYALALATVRWNIHVCSTLRAYTWMWLENQVGIAVKLIPLGQTDGQAMLLQLATEIESWTTRALTSTLADARACTPGLAIASANHEAQYSRLFRS